MSVISLYIVITLHLLCATVVTPLTYKRRPEAYCGRIQTFWTWHARQLVQELKNTKYTQTSRTRVLRIVCGPDLGKNPLVLIF